MLIRVQTIDIREKNGGVVVSTRKPSSKIHVIHKSQHSFSIRPRSSPRRVSGIVARNASKDYRPDLRKVRAPVPPSSAVRRLALPASHSR